MKLLKKIYISIIFFILYLPIVVLIIFSFNDSKSRSVWGGFTFKWYNQLFDNKEILSACYSSLIIAIVSAVVATVLATLAATALLKLKKSPARLVQLITNIPMINPDIVTGISLMILFSFIRFNLGIATLIVSHITFCLPYAFLSVLPKLRSLNPTFYEAAIDLGCTPFRAFLRVVIPQIMPGIITSLMLTFTLSLDDFLISYFVSGTTSTLPITIFSMTRKQVSPEINALSSLFFVLILILLMFVNTRKGEGEDSKKIYI